MMTQTDPNDPKGLIAESFRMESVGPEECRSIFLDWALSQPDTPDPRTPITALLNRYAGLHPEHPMTQVLREGLQEPQRKGRRGGRAARFS